MIVPILIVPKEPGQLAEAIKEEAKLAFNDLVEIMEEEAAAAAARSRGHFGPATGPGVPGGALRLRSGESQRAIGYKTTRDSEWEATVEVGGVANVPAFAGPLNPEDQVLQKLETQEIGRSIGPFFAQKLAFPPGNAGAPTRDPQGVQILTAREFLESPESYGFAYARMTPTAIQGRIIGTRTFVTLFIRRTQVDIPSREPVGSEEAETVRRVEERFSQR